MSWPFPPPAVLAVRRHLSGLQILDIQVQHRSVLLRQHTYLKYVRKSASALHVVNLERHPRRQYRNEALAQRPAQKATYAFTSDTPAQALAATCSLEEAAELLAKSKTNVRMVISKLEVRAAPRKCNSHQRLFWGSWVFGHGLLGVVGVC